MEVEENDISKLADPAAYDHSAILTDDRNVSVDVEEYTGIRLLIQNKWNKPQSVSGLYVWATQGTSKAPVTGLLVKDATIKVENSSNVADDKTVLPEGVYYLTNGFATTLTGEKAFSLGFTSAGTYTIHAPSINQHLKMVKLLMQKN